MTATTFRSCALDRAHVPDYSDLVDVTIDPDTLDGVSYHVTTTRGPSGTPEHHPFALVELGHRLVAIPLEHTHDLATAAASIELLRACFGQPR